MKLIPAIAVVGMIAVAAIVGFVSRAVIEPDSHKKRDANHAELRLTSIVEAGDGYFIDVDYPLLGLPIDGKVKNLVEDAAEDMRRCTEWAPPCPRGASGRFTLTGGLASAYLGPDLVSVGLVLSYYNGGAHGYSTAYGFNFDLRSNRELTLDDALQMLDMSLEDLSASAIEQLKTKPWFIQGYARLGAAPDPENFQTFTVSGESIIFTFQEYQVGPYAAGWVEVTFPRADGMD